MSNSSKTQAVVVHMGMPVSQTWIPATWPARMSGARAEQTSRVHHVFWLCQKRAGTVSY